MRLVVRAMPWLLAVIGLVIPLVRSGFLLAPLIAAWLIVLAFIWIAGRHAIPGHRGPRVVLAIGVLPLLLAAAWEGG
jgi:hypothetical protein